MSRNIYDTHASRLWQKANPGAPMPSWRQLSYWADHGFLGEKRRPGSGGRFDFTEHEFDKLSALAVVAEAFVDAGLHGIPTPVVYRLWGLLDQGPIATLRFGDSLAITATLPNTPTGEPQ